MKDCKPMVEALRRNKAGALDITILLGASPEEGLMGAEEPMESPDEREDREQMDMAPPAESVEADEAAPNNMVAEELAKGKYGPGSMLSKKKV